MSSGVEHARDSRRLASLSFPLAAGAAFMVGYPPLSMVLAGSLAAVGCMLGIPFSPDLDVDHRTYAERMPVIGWVWFLLWIPYAKVIAHRSFHSHGPLWSTALRQLYFLTLIWLIARLTGIEQATWLQFWHWLLTQWWYGWLFVGLLISDLMHWVRDF